MAQVNNFTICGTQKVKCVIYINAINTTIISKMKKFNIPEMENIGYGYNEELNISYFIGIITIAKLMDGISLPDKIIDKLMNNCKNVCDIESVYNKFINFVMI
jgi:hypothetical protein